MKKVCVIIILLILIAVKTVDLADTYKQYRDRHFSPVACVQI